MSKKRKMWDEIEQIEFWKRIRQKEKEKAEKESKQQQIQKNSFWVGVGQIQVRLAAFV